MRYSHQCKNCGKLFESVRSVEKIDEKPRCPNCKSRNTKRLIQPVTAIFKGDDFTKSSNG